MFGLLNNDVIGTVVTRRQVFTPPQRTPAERNVRVIEKIYPHESPDPIRDGATPARPARVPIVTFQSVASILSVMKDEFSASIWAPVHTAAINYWPGGYSGAVNPMMERVNIRRPPTLPYGSIYELSVDDRYELLMGAR